MQIPFTGNAANNNLQGVGDILGAAVDALVGIGAELDKDMKQLFTQRIVDSATTSLENISKSSKDNMTWYDAPMEQPFFHVRSIDSKVSISPGATVVMGGLITEQRKAMDDKVPFLGDIPFIGRLFRSHAEWTNKRNLLIFVTGRLITPAGRELPTNSVEEQGEGEVKAAPVAK
jgi:general secretion pathway protein D